MERWPPATGRKQGPARRLPSRGGKHGGQSHRPKQSIRTAQAELPTRVQWPSWRLSPTTPGRLHTESERRLSRRASKSLSRDPLTKYSFHLNTSKEINHEGESQKQWGSLSKGLTSKRNVHLPTTCADTSVSGWPSRMPP